MSATENAVLMDISSLHPILGTTGWGQINDEPTLPFKHLRFSPILHSLSHSGLSGTIEMTRQALARWQLVAEAAVAPGITRPARSVTCQGALWPVQVILLAADMGRDGVKALIASAMGRLGALMDT